MVMIIMMIMMMIVMMMMMMMMTTMTMLQKGFEDSHLGRKVVSSDVFRLAETSTILFTIRSVPQTSGRWLGKVLTIADSKAVCDI